HLRTQKTRSGETHNDPSLTADAPIHKQRLFHTHWRFIQMKKRLVLFALVALSVATVVFTAVHGQNPNSGNGKLHRQRPDKRIPDQYIVVLKDSVADVEGEAIRLSRDFGGDRNGGHVFQRALKGFSVRMSEERAAKLAEDPRVAYVEED